MATTFKQWLAAHPKISQSYSNLSTVQQNRYKTKWKNEGSAVAQDYMHKIKGNGKAGVVVDFDTWLNNNPEVKADYTKLADADKEAFKSLFTQKGGTAAKTFLNDKLSKVSVDTATTEVDGVSVPTPTTYPSPTIVTPPEDITAPTTDTVPGVDAPTADTVDGVDGATLTRTEGVDSTTADASTFNMTDPMEFASKYSEFYRGEALKNASTADQIALQQLNTELAGLTDFAKGAAALKRSETSIDNEFNQAQRIKQVNSALPGVQEDLAAQRDRANAYAEGRLPNAIEDRMMELNTRSASVDNSSAAGFGSGSLATQKASTLMSAQQRMGVAMQGEQLLGQNIANRSELYLSPTEYSNAGSQINAAPTQSASALAASSMSQLNELANVSASTALGTSVNQQQFSSNMANSISQFNANIENQKAQFNAQLESNQNLSEAEIKQRTEEFNANIAVQQNQFNSTLVERANEFNANMAVQQNQFSTSIQQRVNEFNATNEFNTLLTNAGIQNTFALGAFDYNVTYKGMIAGALNSAKDTRLQLDLAYKELEIYEAAQAAQLEFEREKLDILAANMEANDVANNVE